MPHATCTLVFRCDERMDFKWLASVWFLLASFILKQSIIKQWNDSYKADPSSGCNNEIKEHWETVFHLQTHQQPFGDFYFLKQSMQSHSA